MNKTTYNKRIKAIEDRAANAGATFTHSFYGKDHLECFWYNGYSIAEIEYKGYTVCFDVTGEVNIAVYPKGNFEKDPLIFTRKGESKLFEDVDCRAAIANDDKLAKLDLEGNLDFDNNNWINITVIKKTSDSWENVTEPEVAGESNLLEAVDNNFDYYIQYIDNLTSTTKAGPADVTGAKKCYFCETLKSATELMYISEMVNGKYEPVQVSVCKECKEEYEATFPKG